MRERNSAARTADSVPLSLKTEGFMWGKKVKSLSHVRLFATPWTIAYQVLCPWDFPGKNTGVGCHFLLQGIFPTQGLNPGLLHCRQTLYHLSHQGSPYAGNCCLFRVERPHSCPQHSRQARIPFTMRRASPWVYFLSPVLGHYTTVFPPPYK